MVSLTRPLSAICLLLVLAVAAASAQQEPDLDNDVIPNETPQINSASDSQSSASPVTTEKAPPASDAGSTKAPASTRPTDFFSRLVDDFIQIPIAALRAVNQLLNNMSQRNRDAAALNATASTPVGQASASSR